MRAAQRPLTAGWVAGSVRARHMLLRRVGPDGARALAEEPSLARAISRLARTAYGRSVREGMSLGAARRGIAETTLWHVRVLAGWAPPRALEAVRALAAWFELVNIEERVAYLRDGAPPSAFELGGLAGGWPRLARAQSVSELRAGLGGSVWRDPGTDDPGGIAFALRLAWAERVADAVPEAEAWVAGAVALIVARERFLSDRALPPRRVPGIGERSAQAPDLASMRAALPSQARWALAGVDDASRLWEAEAAWWRRVDTDAEQLARSPGLGRATLIGSVALLGVDAFRTAAALEVASRGGQGAAREVFELLF